MERRAVRFLSLLDPEFGLTLREIVIGSVIALRQLQIERPREDASDEYVMDWAELLALTLLNLKVAIGSKLSESDLELDGLPRWIAGPEGGDPAKLLVDLACDLDDRRPGKAIAALPDKTRNFSRHEHAEFLLELAEWLNQASRSPAVALAGLVDAGNPEDLAARAGVLGADALQIWFDDMIRRRDAAPESERTRMDEIIGRAERVDVPTADKTGALGFLLSAELTLSDTGDARVQVANELALSSMVSEDNKLVKGWRAAASTFVSGVRIGAEAARAHLEQIDPELARDGFVPSLTLRGVLPPYRAKEDSVALPVAVEILRRKLNLPPADCATSGAIKLRPGDSFEVSPLDPQVSRGKLNGVRDDGFRAALLAPLKESLEYPEPGLRPLIASRMTLDRVARQLWGELYEERVKENLVRRLAGWGFAVGWGDRQPSDEEELFVKTTQADKLETDLRSEASPAAWVLGSPPQSGKTWMVFDVVTRLSKTDDWAIEVLHVSPYADQLDELSKAVEKVVSYMVVAKTGRTKRLVVVDGIRFSDDMVGLDRELQRLVNRCNAHILVVRQADLSSDWKLESKEVEPLYGQAAVNEFVARLIEQHGDKLEDAGTLDYALRQGAEVQAARELQDLWWIKERARGTESIEHLRERLLDGTSEGERWELEMLAYASLYGMGVPDALLHTLSKDRLRERYAFLDSQTKEWVIPYRIVSLAIVTLEPDRVNRVRIDQSAGAQRILPVIEHHVKTHSHHRLTVISAHLSRAWWPTLRYLFGGQDDLGLVTPEIRSKLTAETEPWQLARLALAIVDHVAESNSLDLVRSMLVRLAQKLDENAIGCREVRACMAAAEAYRGLLIFDADDAAEPPSGGVPEPGARAASPSQSLTVPWKQLCRKLCRGYYRLTRDESNPPERLRLANSIASLGFDDLSTEVAGNIDLLMDDVAEMEDGRYGHAWRVIELAQTLSRTTPCYETEEAEKIAFERAEELIDGVTPRSTFTGFLDFCEWLRLRLNTHQNNEQYLDFEQEIEDVSKPLLRLLQSATLSEVTRGLGLLHEEDTVFLVRLLDRKPIVTQNLIRSGQGGLGEIADFLGAMTRWHRRKALALLYQGESTTVPNRGLARLLAVRVQKELDARNAGRLITVTHALDEIFGESKNGFAEAFVDALGDEFIKGRIEAESRPSIISYLIQGLAEIEHPFLEKVREATVNHIATTIDQSLQAWPARLAVRLCEGRHTSEMFLRDFTECDSINRSRIVDAMLDAPNVDALDAYHRFGTLFEGVDREFAEIGRPDEAARRLRFKAQVHGRADLTFQAANAMKETYRRSGRWETSDFTREFRFDTISKTFNAIRAEVTSQAVDHLSSLDHESAASFLRSKRGHDILTDKLWRLTRHPGLAAQLLHSINRILPGKGAELLQSRSLSKGVLEHKLRFTQNPRELASTANLLFRAGYDDKEVVGRIYDDAWSKQIATLRSPAALVEILVMLRTLDRDTGSDRAHQAASAIDAEALVRRLQNGWIEDLVYVPSLCTLLDRAGQNDAAKEVALAFAERPDLPSALPPIRWFGALRALRAILPDRLAGLWSAFDAEAMRSATHPVQLDDVTLWHALGAYFLFRAKASSKTPPDFCEPPASLVIPKDPATVLWATLRLNPRPWVREMQASAIDELVHRPWRVPAQMRFILQLCARELHLPTTAPDLNQLLEPRESDQAIAPLARSDLDALSDLMAAQKVSA